MTIDAPDRRFAPRRAALSQHEHAALGLARLGWGPSEMAMLLDMDEAGAIRAVRRALAKLGVDAPPEAVTLAQRLTGLQ
jgi:DNA-binding CsgD family transcriptional regulator